MTAQAIVKPVTRSLTLMGNCGDCEMSWEEEHDAEIKALVTRMMAEGVTFFQLKKGVFRKRNEKIASVEDIDSRLISFADKDFERIFFNQSIEMTRRGVGRIETTGKIIRDPAIVAASHTVATPRLSGG